MNFHPTALSLLLPLAGTILAQSTDNPQCIDNCISTNPTSSWCDGDEEGEALESCTCASLSGSLMIQCMEEDCSSSDREAYLENVPDLCRDDLFEDSPGGGSDDDNDDDQTGDGEAISGTGPARTNSEAGASASENGEGPSATTGGEEPGSTADDASDEGAEDDSGAIGRAVSGLLAAGGLLAAFLM